MCNHLVRVSTPEAADLTKLLENIFCSVNIALQPGSDSIARAIPGRA